ncbi:DBH-like monooxygenase protein 2 homolog isoform X2 [Triplophysa dalaica]|uniref:DBH-like monooxygenase protein 2 homolog isoform X2 n=1 Tax=Triplophysa dalaica TaxID=1582913 RepID=UPI0024E01CA1|nr:DBH-like monooxygenase protein 2 homolog isoform X2 [Triplophysa dalaica]
MGLLSVLLLVLVSVRLCWAQDDPLLPFSEHLDPEHKVRLRWGFDEVRDTILFELTVNTSGWVGFGFSPKGGMNKADIVLGGVGQNGTFFTDYHAVGNSMPVVDKQQDYKLLSLTQSDGQTVMKFQRSIKSCDENDLPITTNPIKLIYAYGLTADIKYHSNRRGTKEVNLLRYMPKVTPTDSKFFDMVMVNFTVPAEQTHYHCKIMRTPDFDQKHHIYRIEPLIQNVDLVHHLLLYRCPPGVTEVYESQCYTEMSNEQCMEVVAVWGIGGGAFELPEVAGLPIGGNDGDVLYRLEVHYNNPNKNTGRVDHSGLRFFYTSELRPHDAAALTTGLAVGPLYVIPPRAKTFHTYGLCDTTHFPKVLSETPQDLQVFSVLLHTHLAGRKVRVGHFRDGKQIDLLAQDEHYNFEYQEATNLGKIKTVKLGDTLLVQCTYNTENRTGLTLGGLSTSDEMCLAFLYYYPAMNLSGCLSIPDSNDLKAEMGAIDDRTWITMMLSKTWNDTSVYEYQQTLKGINQILIVSNSNNASYNIGLIPDLRVTYSSPCNESFNMGLIPNLGVNHSAPGVSGSTTERLAWMSLLLCLAVQWISS